MLTTLRIKNLALVADLTWELNPGYSVITGETGAGKSILIGALELILGERADRAAIRSGCDQGTVEAEFDVSGLRAPLGAFLESNGLEPCEQGRLVLKRVLTASGANRQFVNGTPTTLAILAALGEWLVDIHGPHDHQSLLQPAQQLALLDAYGDLQPERAAFGELVRRRAALQAAKAALAADEQTAARQLDLLRFQVREIASANLRPDEEAELTQAHQRASHAARLLQLSHQALDLLSEGDPALLTQAGVLGRTVQELRRLDPSAAPLAELHEQAVAALRALQAALARYADQVEVDPARLGEWEDRLNLLQALKRKYGGTLAEVLAFGEAAQRRLAELEQREAELARLNDQLRQIETELVQTGQRLSARRRQVIPRLARAVARQLADLGFQQSRFDIALTSLPAGAGLPPQLSPSGFDTVAFQFAPNPGEPARPLRAIASSGELARVMLALKTVLAAQDDIPVLIFDEVDANIGGQTANAVGDKLRQLATRRQVLCITHLPQVAAPARAHFLVTKQVKEGRTISEIALLDSAGRVTELARMMGGQSEAARRHARALLASGSGGGQPGAAANRPGCGQPGR